MNLSARLWRGTRCSTRLTWSFSAGRKKPLSISEFLIRSINKHLEDR